MTDRIRSASGENGRGHGARTGTHPQDPREERAPRPAPHLRLLAVGGVTPTPPDAADATGAGATTAEITCLPFAEVTVAALDDLRPDVVYSALVGAGFDCFDLAERLAAAGFRGQYRVVAPTLPDPGLVRREIADRFPALDFDIVFLDHND